MLNLKIYQHTLLVFFLLSVFVLTLAWSRLQKDAASRIPPVYSITLSS